MKTRCCLLFLLACFSFPIPAADNTVSVLYFQNTTGSKEQAWLSKGLADMLISDLALVKQLVVVEREELEKVIKEQELALSGLLNEAAAPQVGSLLNAQRLIYGSFIVQQASIRIDARIVESATGKVSGSVQVKEKLENVFGLEKKLCLELLKAMQIDPAALPAAAQAAETTSLQAARTYYAGIELFDAGKMEEALQQFKEANSLDPLYAKPQKSLEDAYQYLKDFKKMQKQREINSLSRKALALKKRLDGPVFYTFADVVMNPGQYGYKAEDVPGLAQTDPTLALGNTPAQCTWHLQLTLIELSRKYRENFDDAKKEEFLLLEAIALGKKARTVFSRDPFLPEILYQELPALRTLGRWQEVKDACEYLMATYPDFRMMYAVEDFYERALDKLAKK